MKSSVRHRRGYRYSTEKLRRGRRLYARLIRGAVENSGNKYRALMAAANHMSRSKVLWSCGLPKDIAFSILSKWRKDDDAITGKWGGSFGGYRWCEANGWDKDIIRLWSRTGGHGMGMGAGQPGDDADETITITRKELERRQLNCSYAGQASSLEGAADTARQQAGKRFADGHDEQAKQWRDVSKWLDELAIQARDAQKKYKD